MKTRRYLFGEWRDASAPLTEAEAEELCTRAETHRKEIASYPLDRALRTLNEVRKIWMDPGSPCRREAADILPGLTGFSREMIELGLNELGSMLNPEILTRKVRTEFMGVPRVTGFQFDRDSKRAQKWYPLGTVLHVLSGNVFLVGPGSIVEGVLTGNVSILKMSSGETYFIPKFLETLQSCDKDGVLSRSIAAIDFPSSAAAIQEIFKKRVDGLLIWGGEEAVQSYRGGLPARTRSIIFGPKLSIGLVTEAGLREKGAQPAARALSEELAIWDQNACTAPQVCFVERRKNAESFLASVADAMKETGSRMPPGKATPDAAAEIHKLRSVFEVAEARGEGKVIESDSGVDWTLVLDLNQAIEPSPLHRTIRIVPFDRIDEVLTQAASLRGYIQTVGVVATAAEHLELAEKFGKEGALRIVPLGRMAGGEIDDPHDGCHDLPQLMNLVAVPLKLPDPAFEPWDILSDSEKKSIVDARLRCVVDSARKSSFYAKKLDGKSIGGIEDLEKIPLLTREDWERDMIPRSRSFETRDQGGGHVTRSGGSTGEPKFSYFDGEDWEAMCEASVRTFKAAGFSKKDRIANFMSAGDMYGSFLSFNDVNVKIGMMSFPFAGKADPAQFLKIAKDFGINAAQGVPTLLIPFLRKCKELDQGFKLARVMYAGQPMSSADRRWLHESCGVETVCSVIGTTEAGEIGYQCSHLTGSDHHLVEEYNHVELLDENDRPVKDGETGRMVVTSLMKHNYPVLRFQIGDAGRALPDRCKCGRKDRVIRYLGRWDDIISIGLMNVHYHDVKSAVGDLEVSELQAVAANGSGVETLVLKIESATGDRKSLEVMAREALFGKIPKMRDLEKAGAYALTIEVLAPGTLERNSRTGKVKAVVDERK